MDAKLLFLAAVLAALFAITKEEGTQAPFAGSYEPVELDPAELLEAVSLATELTSLEQNERHPTKTPFMQSRGQTSETPLAQNGSHTTKTPLARIIAAAINRANYSKYHGNATTTAYVAWWKTTPRPSRPSYYYKNFPGRTGVPSWKEISLGTSMLDLQNRKPKTPATSSVSSASQNTAFYFQIAVNSFCLAFFLFCFCRP